ncbi:MAG: hypothetical protein ABI876_07080 [Bacteroidota bacterium]
MKPISLVFLISILTIGGCVPRKDRSGLLKGIKTAQVRLDPRHTELPPLEITLPDGFVASWTTEAKYDQFYIFNPADTGDVQHAMLVVEVTPYPPRQIPDSARFEKSRGGIGDIDVDWRELTIIDEIDSAKLYQREMTTGEVFKKGGGTYADKGIAFHAFVVGSDPKLVEKLTAAVETVKVLPARPNL